MFTPSITNSSMIITNDTANTIKIDMIPKSEQMNLKEIP